MLQDRGKGSRGIPPGKQTLKITLFDHPATQAPYLEVGKIYRFNNVRLNSKENFTEGRCGNLPRGQKNEILVPDMKDRNVQELKR